MTAVRPGAASPSEGTLLHGVPMIRLEKNDRVLEQILLLQMIKHLSDQLVGRRDEEEVGA